MKLYYTNFNKKTCIVLGEVYGSVLRGVVVSDGRFSKGFNHGYHGYWIDFKRVESNKEVIVESDDNFKIYKGSGGEIYLKRLYFSYYTRVEMGNDRCMERHNNYQLPTVLEELEQIILKNK